MGNDSPHPVINLELRLLTADVRGDRIQVEALLDPAFVEVGASGRRWTRAELIAALVTERADEGGDVIVTDVTAVTLSDNLALVTYVSERRSQRVRRASIWRRSEGRWRILYHQGTPTDKV